VNTLLLLASLLQQSSVEVKQQLMEQQDGTLLLQLLYHVLRDQRDLMAEQPVRYQTQLFNVLETMKKKGIRNVIEVGCEQGVLSLAPLSLLGLVLMVLQSLLFHVANPWDLDVTWAVDATIGLEMRDGKCLGS
jgi:head-tail adaptor